MNNEFMGSQRRNKGKAFQATGMDWAKALRQKNSWYVSERANKSVWLEWSEREGKG